MDYKNDFGTALQNQQKEARNSLFTQARDAQTSVFNELSEIDAQVAKHQSHENLNQMNIIGSLVKLSYNSGRAPSRQVLQVASQKLGLADDNQIISAGMNKDGGYDIEIGGYDANGNLIPRGRQTLSPQTIFNMSLNMPGIFDDADRRRISDRLIENGLIARTDAQKMINSSYDMWNNNYTPQGTVVNSEWAGYNPRDPRKGGISAFASDGKGGFSRSEYDPMTREYSRQEWGTRDPNYKGRWKALAIGPIGADGQSGTRYENDKTGDVVFVPEGTTPPWVEDKNKGSEKMAIEQLKQKNMNQRQQERTDHQRAMQETKMSADMDRFNQKMMLWREKNEAAKNKAKTDALKNKYTARSNEMESLRKQYQMFSHLAGDFNYSQEDREEAMSMAKDSLEKMQKLGFQLDDGDNTQGDSGDKAGVKPNYNGVNGATVATQDPPNGRYEIEKNGIKYHWGKSKSGKWGYFPNKK